MKCRLSESQNAEIPSLSRTHFPKDVSVALTFFTLDIMSSYYLSCIPEEGGSRQASAEMRGSLVYGDGTPTGRWKCFAFRVRIQYNIVGTET